MNKLDAQVVLRAAESAAVIVGKLETAGFLREAMIARLVGGGGKLSSVVKLTGTFNPTAKEDLPASQHGITGLDDLPIEFDILCEKQGCGNLRTDLRSYIHTLLAPSDERFWLFPSRESNGHITPRTAQRRLKDALTSLDLGPNDFSYKKVARHGRGLRQLRAAHSLDRQAQIEESLKKLSRMMKQLFPVDVHEREDAAQNVAQAISQRNPFGILPDQEAFEIGKKVLRNYHSHCKKTRTQEVAGILDDCEDWYPSESDDAVQRVQLRERVFEVISTLRYREREILKLRFGLGSSLDDDEWEGFAFTREEVGHIFRISAARVGQIEHRALQRLQHPERVRRFVEFC